MKIDLENIFLDKNLFFLFFLFCHYRDTQQAIVFTILSAVKVRKYWRNKVIFLGEFCQIP
jgi:hypothetical protein